MNSCLLLYELDVPETLNEAALIGERTAICEEKIKELLKARAPYRLCRLICLPVVDINKERYGTVVRVPRECPQVSLTARLIRFGYLQ